jgi:hypothetical protein
MVLSTDGLRKKILDRDKELMADLEQKLDEALAQNFDLDGRVSVNTSFFSDISDIGRQELFDKYRSEGWHIWYDSGFRNESHYVFSDEPQPSSDMRECGSLYSYR